MKTQILFFTFLQGQKVGTDEFGNVYYRSRPFWSRLFARFGLEKKERRWVIYKGTIEASKVPAQWFGWLHFTQDEPLADSTPHSWVKGHLPNLSGTKDAHTPPYSIKTIPKRHINGVQSWQPRNNA